MQQDSLENIRNALPVVNLAPAEPSSRLPGFRWIQEAFAKTVRLNENWHHTKEIPVNLRPLPSATMAFRASMLKSRICQPDKHTRTVADKILSILLNSHFRKGALSAVSEHLPVFRRAIDSAIEESRPVNLVLPTLPCKNLNPLCTDQQARAVDLGEYAFFAQLRDIHLSIQGVFPPGARITVVCDGIVYADIFWDGDADSANRYRESCENIRDEMGLAGIVDLIDMSSLVAGEPRFEKIRWHIASVINELGSTEDVSKEKLAMLRRGMLMNLPLNKFSFDEIAHIQSFGEEEWPREVFEETHQAAVSFASFLLAAQHTAIISRAFPLAIRCTVHPKNAPQLPLHLVNRNSVVFPYNGVTVVSRSKWDRKGDLREAIRTARLYEVLAQPNATVVHRVGDSHTFFFMVD